MEIVGCEIHKEVARSVPAFKDFSSRLTRGSAGTSVLHGGAWPVTISFARVERQKTLWGGHLPGSPATWGRVLRVGKGCDTGQSRSKTEIRKEAWSLRGERRGEVLQARRHTVGVQERRPGRNVTMARGCPGELGRTEWRRALHAYLHTAVLASHRPPCPAL